MYLFFIISGYLFVVGASIILNYIYELFPITKITKFLSPLDDTVFNKIGIIIIPNIIWALIEIIILGNNILFILGFILNVFVSLCMMYVIKYGYYLIANTEKNIVNIIAISFSSFFGFFCNYICLLIGVNKTEINIIYSLLALLILIAFYIIIRIFPPNSEFFRGKSTKNKS